MKKVGRPLGLIGYETDKNITRRQAGQKPQFRLVRTRTLLYAALIAAVGAVMLFGLSSRATLEVNVLRDRTPPFVRLSDGSIRNAYTVKIINKANEPRDFRITFKGPEGLIVSSIGDVTVENALTITADGDGLRSVRIFVTLPPSALGRASGKLVIIVEETSGGERVENRTAFMKGNK
jgi:polyferredoxin